MKGNNDFNSLDLELSQLAKCLSHPARIQIIAILSRHKDRTCKEIVAELPLSQSTVSKHLKDLLEENLICRKLSGTQSLYTLEWNKLERVFTIFERFNKKTMVHRPKRNCC
ncbi:ArsR/SmtB family transcription factor [Flavobacterium tiangeerense]|uniref:ArsR/SmtB family transcription factor n=1 Tax=Flavobacterium tiangeerense TaxID=459471 RepID=UPI00119E9429|nr:winged helix-turn-helix domain-containing protein [Flavobacterium tiangeerense]